MESLLGARTAIAPTALRNVAPAALRRARPALPAIAWRRNQPSFRPGPRGFAAPVAPLAPRRPAKQPSPPLPPAPLIEELPTETAVSPAGFNTMDVNVLRAW